MESKKPMDPLPQPWGEHFVPTDDIRSIALGPLVLWVQARRDEIWVASRPGTWTRKEEGAEDRLPEDRDWVRWPVSRGADRISRKVLREVADANPLCLMKPEPVILFDGYGESALNFSFRVWATRENWLELKNTINQEVKDRFDQEGIEIPFPHRTLYAGLASEPFPVRVVDERHPRAGDPDRERDS